MDSIIKLFDTIDRRVYQIADIIGVCFSLPFRLIAYIKKGGVAEHIGNFLLLPNVFIWFLVYRYLLHVILLTLGFTDADFSEAEQFSALFIPLSTNPHDHFGTVFFAIFFPLMLFYIYLTQTKQWDTEKLRKLFAGSSEHIPTRKELNKEKIKAFQQREKWRRMPGFFCKCFAWSFSILFVLLALPMFGAGEGTTWGEIFFMSFWLSVVISVLFTILSGEWYMRRQRTLIKKGD